MNKVTRQFNELAKRAIKALESAKAQGWYGYVKLTELEPLAGETWNGIRKLAEEVRNVSIKLEDQLARGVISEPLAAHKTQIIKIMAVYLDTRCEIYQKQTGKRPASEIHVVDYSGLNPRVTEAQEVNVVPFPDLSDPHVGQQYGRLTVMARIGTIKGHAVWMCKCDCKAVGFVLAQDVKAGKTQSCGCYHTERNSEAHRSHGGSQSKLYKTWSAMKARCDKPDHPDFDHYGGRGITYCDSWTDFQAFELWALSHGYNDNLTLDRKDNDGDYAPDNCRWATMKEQSNNRRSNIRVTLNGEIMTLKEAAKKSGLPYGALRERYRKNGEAGLFRPIKQRKQNSTNNTKTDTD